MRVVKRNVLPAIRLPLKKGNEVDNVYSYFASFLDLGDQVNVTNAKEVARSKANQERDIRRASVTLTGLHGSFLGALDVPALSGWTRR